MWSKRALRRHHLKRMQARARRVYLGDPNAARYADHLKVCSCSMCGNQRRWFGPPFRERRLEGRR